jgi:hypothetical protein
VEHGVVAVISAVRVDLLERRVEAVDGVVEPLDEISLEPPETLNFRARMPDVPIRRVRRRERPKRLVIRVAEARAGIIVELREKRLEVIVERLRAIDEFTLRHTLPVNEIVVGLAEILGDGQEGRVIDVGDAGVGVELGEDGVELRNEVFDLVDEIVLIEAAIAHPFIFPKSHRPPCLY